MKAMELLQLYSGCFINQAQSGLLEDVYFNSSEEYVKFIFGQDTEVLFGEFEYGKTYFFTYCDEDSEPSGLKHYNPIMIAKVDDKCTVWVYEIEE